MTVPFSTLPACHELPLDLRTLQPQQSVSVVQSYGLFLTLENICTLLASMITKLTIPAEERTFEIWLCGCHSFLGLQVIIGSQRSRHNFSAYRSVYESSQDCEVLKEIGDKERKETTIGWGHCVVENLSVFVGVETEEVEEERS